MTSQDVISFKQTPIKIINDKETLEVFQDENLMNVVKFLRRGPMSITDLVKAFNEVGEEKSDKTIYRYLHKLIRTKLVAKAGKRVTSVKEDELVSETIYLRTAKAFITIAPLEGKEFVKGIECPIWASIRLLLQDFYGKQIDPEKFNKFINHLDKTKDKLVIDLFKKAESKTLDKIAELDWNGMNMILQYVGWLVLAKEMEISSELQKVMID